MTAVAASRYLPPGRFTRHVFNPMICRLARMGVSVRGSSELRIKGRTSGIWRSTVVNPLPYDGGEFLVAPRGTTQWVRISERRGLPSCGSGGACAKSPQPTWPMRRKWPYCGHISPSGRWRSESSLMASARTPPTGRSQRSPLRTRSSSWPQHRGPIRPRKVADVMIR